MAETLLSPSNILLYGRVLTDLTLDLPRDPTLDSPTSATSRRGAGTTRATSTGSGSMVASTASSPPQKGGQNRFLERQLTADKNVPERVPKLARIYGFSYEGHYYDLARAAIFLVHGPGDDPEAPRPAPDSRVARAPADADRIGIAYTDRSFADDIKVWTYDKGDFSIRLDPETGPLEQILLQAELRSDKLQTYYSGQDLFLRRNRPKGMSD
jgi:hypothetical protein